MCEMVGVFDFWQGRLSNSRADFMRDLLFGKMVLTNKIFIVRFFNDIKVLVKKDGKTSYYQKSL